MMRNGLSFLEVLIALFILVLCLLPMYDLMERSGRSAKMTREEILANLLALELVNQIRGMPFSLVPPLADLALPDEENGRLLRQTESGSRILLSSMPAKYSRSLTVESMGDFLKKITVQVGWDSMVSRRLTLVTFLAWSP